jgi:hypothetical protein
MLTILSAPENAPIRAFERSHTLRQPLCFDSPCRALFLRTFGGPHVLSRLLRRNRS